MKENKQQKLAELLISKGSVDLLDLQRGTHGVRTSNPASLIFELRKKGYDITTYENSKPDGTYVSTVYKLNYVPLPKDITKEDKRDILYIREERNKMKKQLKQLKESEEYILSKY